MGSATGPLRAEATPEASSKRPAFLRPVRFNVLPLASVWRFRIQRGTCAQSVGFRAQPHVSCGDLGTHSTAFGGASQATVERCGEPGRISPCHARQIHTRGGGRGRPRPSPNKCLCHRPSRFSTERGDLMMMKISILWRGPELLRKDPVASGLLPELRPPLRPSHSQACTA